MGYERAPLMGSESGFRQDETTHKSNSSGSRYHTILAILEVGSREVKFVNHSTEWAMCWKEKFEASKERGVAQADLVVSKLSIAIEFPSRIG